MVRNATVVLLSVTLGVSSIAEAQIPAPQAESPLSAFVGNYDVAPGHILGIDLYSEGSEPALVYSDYQSGVIRRLTASPGGFSAGPGFGVATPTMFTVQFDSDGTDVAPALVVESVGKPALRATRLPVASTDVRFGSSDTTLAGTLLVPRSSSRRHPAIVLLHGSGRLTRHSFGPYPHFFTSLGLAVLTYDKRGTGASTGRFFDRTTQYPDVFADDALEAVRFLRTRPDIDPSQIGVWGASEGGMLATQVAARSSDVAFAINSSGFMVPLWQQVMFNIESQLTADGFSREEVAEAVGFERFAMQVMRTGERWDEFQEAQNAAKRTKWFKAYFGGGNGFSTVESLRRQWNYVYSFDPLPALKSIRCPVLGVFGELDTSTPARRSAENLRIGVRAGGNPNVTVKVFKGTNHPLMAARTGGPSEMPALGNMSPGVFETLREWIQTVIRAKVATES